MPHLSAHPREQSSYVIWPAAARELLAHLPIDCPTDCYISKLVLEGRITAVVGTPCLAEQRDPYGLPRRDMLLET